jgi:hypothetical protein
MGRTILVVLTLMVVQSPQSLERFMVLQMANHIQMMIYAWHQTAFENIGAVEFLPDIQICIVQEGKNVFKDNARPSNTIIRV